MHRTIKNLCEVAVTNDPESLYNTVRKGTRYVDMVGEKATFVKTEGDTETFLHDAFIESAEVLPFHHIGPAVISSNHSPGGRTYEGLLQQMKDGYEGFQEDDIVTVVWYRVLDFS